MSLWICANDDENKEGAKPSKAKRPKGPFDAETEGFEPSIPFGGIHTFQACSFNHSDKSPWGCKNKCIRSEAEDFFGICRGDQVHFLSGDAFQFCDFIRNMNQIG